MSDIAPPDRGARIDASAEDLAGSGREPVGARRDMNLSICRFLDIVALIGHVTAPRADSVVPERRERFFTGGE